MCIVWMGGMYSGTQVGTEVRGNGGQDINEGFEGRDKRVSDFVLFPKCAANLHTLGLGSSTRQMRRLGPAARLFLAFFTCFGLGVLLVDALGLIGNAHWSFPGWGFAPMPRGFTRPAGGIHQGV
jgi:hypothetical protein